MTREPLNSEVLRRRGPLPPCPGARHTWVELPTGIRMHIAEAGPPDGDPVLALHGWPQHWWMWRTVMPALAAEGLRIICPDARGAGWTSTAPDRDYRKQRMVEDVCALLDALDLPSVSVLGHDWGGWVGFLLAQSEPGRVRRLMACSIVAPWRGSRSVSPRDLRFAYQPLLAAPRLGPALLRRRGFAEGLMRRASANPSSWTNQELAVFADVIRRPEVAVASSLYYRDFLAREARDLPRLSGPAAALPMPVLQVLGDRDLVTSRLTLDRGADPDWTVALVPGCGHFLFDEEPDLAVQMARSFLASN